MPHLPIKDRIDLALEYLKSEWKELRPSTSFSKKLLVEYSEFLIKTGFVSKDLVPLKGNILSRVKHEVYGLAENRKKQVLETIEAILSKYCGYDYDPKKKDYVRRHPFERPYFPSVEELPIGHFFQAGLTDIFPSFPRDEFFKDVENAIEVNILQSFLPGAAHFFDKLLRGNQGHLKKIRLLLVMPYSNAAHIRAKALGKKPKENINTQILSNLDIILRQVDKNDHLRNILEIRFYDQPPVTSLYGFKNKKNKFIY